VIGHAYTERTFALARFEHGIAWVWVRHHWFASYPAT